MRILFLGNTQGTSSSLHYFTALSRLGHEVLPFDPSYFTSDHPVERALLRLRKRPLASRVRNVASALISLCRGNRFDLIFVMAETFFSHEAMTAIRSLGSPSPVFLFHSHDNVFAPGICRPSDFELTLKSYDVVFTTKSQNVARYRALGQARTHYIPSAFEPTVHHPIPDSHSRYAGRGLKVSFIGTYDHSRRALLQAAGWDRLHVWGNGWADTPEYAEHRERIFGQAVYYFELADIHSHSRISLGLLRTEAGDLHTQRTFEIPASGGFQLAPRNEEILSYFEEGKEIACFGSPEELKDKVEYYLAHRSEHEKIARAGRERCLHGRHTYLDRVAEMMRVVIG